MSRLVLIVLLMSPLSCSSKKPASEEDRPATGASAADPTHTGVKTEGVPASPADASSAPDLTVAGAGSLDAGLLAYQLERRLEPTAAGNPTHATVRLLRKIGEGDWDLEPLISETRGLVIVFDGKNGGKRYCGDRLARGREQAMRYFDEVILRLRWKEVEISCSNKPRPPRCFIGFAGEQYDPFEMRFADSERGLELTAIVSFGWGQTEADQKAESDAVEAELIRLTEEPCPRTL